MAEVGSESESDETDYDISDREIDIIDNETVTVTSVESNTSNSTDGDFQCFNKSNKLRKCSQTLPVDTN